MGQTKRNCSILIADGNLLFRRGLHALFAGDAGFTVVSEAAGASDLVAKIGEFRPDVLVIDADFLVGNRDRLGILVRQTQPGLLILVVAKQDTEQNMAAAIACGAKGLVLKSAAPAQFLAALRNVAFQEGGMNLSGLLPEFHALATYTPVNTISSVLTAREQEVVKLLAEGKTVRLVAHELSLSVKTIEAHKLNLMRKLDIHDRATLVAYANRNGMVVSANCAG